MLRLTVFVCAVLAVQPALAAAQQSPAKLAVKRAAIKDGRLDVLAAVTMRAKGSVRVRYRAAGMTTAFSAKIGTGKISFTRLLPRAQRRRNTGIVTLSYLGSETVHADSVRLRAAPRKARLKLTSAAIDPLGTLVASGTISGRARGKVRVRLEYEEQGGVFELHYTAVIDSGRWSVTTALPRVAAATGGQLSVQFTGYARRKIRGEQVSRRVTT